MERRVRRAGLAGALTVATLAGCAGRSPFVEPAGPGPAADFAGRGDGRGWDARVAVRGGSPDEPPVLGEGATLGDYLRYAALNNAGLEARFHEWQAAVERLPQVEALPDPMLTYGYYVREVETRVGPMEHSLSMSQRFPLFGKLRDRRDAAAHDAHAAYERLEVARLDLFYRVERAWNELYFLKRSIEITRDNMDLLEQLERVARTRYQVATAGHADILKTQVELGTLEDHLRQLLDLRGPYAARLNDELNRPADAMIPWPGSVAESVCDASSDRLVAVLRERNPELRALQAELERDRVRTDLARKERLPDLTVGLGYTFVGKRDDFTGSENGEDDVLATFSINLPIWPEKYDALAREAVARRLAAAGRRGEAASRLERRLQEAMFEHQDSRRRVNLYRETLLPKAGESLQASLGGFEQSQSDFLDLIDAQRTLLEFQLRLERALVDRATSYADLERLIGVPLTDLEPPDASEP